MKIALVHDWLNNLGGAERVLFELHNMYPEAPIYTLFYNPKLTAQHIPHAQIRPSRLQNFPFIRKFYKYFMPLMPMAMESFDFSEFDLVISSSVNFSKGLILKPGTKHICYCYSPTRFLWDQNHEYQKQNSTSPLKKWLTRVSQHLLRIWDRQTAERVDVFVAISDHVQKRIKKYYGKEASIIYPPVAFTSEQLPIHSDKNFYLIVSRLFPHKNIDIAIEVFNKLGLELVIIGDGPIKKNLQKMAGKNISFLGELPDNEIIRYYSQCRAFIMPQEEDFGLTPIEAMSFGKPVLALAKGGATETLIEGVTGEFFDDPIPEALADGMRRLNENYSKYSPLAIKSQTEKFSRNKFQSQIRELVTRLTT